jgi:hypothetical protein
VTPPVINDGEPYRDDRDDFEPECLICGGQGWEWGCDLGDPLWYDDDEVVTCSSCGGSGLAKDMTWC